MNITLIAGIGKNRELGRGNELLWHLPADLAHFRQRTTGSPIVMGRKTYDSIGRPLPKRKNIVISRDPNLKIEGVTVVSSLDDAIAEAKKESPETVFIIGGASVYAQALPLSTHLSLTEIDAEAPDADTFFPEWRNAEFVKTSETFREKDEQNPFDMRFSEWERVKMA